MKKILILLFLLMVIPASGMMQNDICPDTLTILVHTPPAISSAVSNSYTIYPNKTTHIRFSVLKNAGAPDLPIILIHEFNNAQPDTVIGKMPDILVPLHFAHAQQIARWNLYVSTDSGLVLLSYSSLAIQSTEIEPDSLSYSKDGEYYNICIRVKKTASLDCTPVQGAIEMAMTKAKGNSITCTAEPTPLAEDAGNSYTFRFNLPVNAQPAVFTVDPGDKFYIKAKNRGYYFWGGFIHKQAYENYIINQSKQKNFILQNPGLNFAGCVDFCSPVKNTGFLLFRDKLMATTNGGATWSESVLCDKKGEPYYSGIHPDEVHLKTVYFSDRLHGWIGAYYDPAYTKLPFPTNQDESAIKKHGIFKTADGGKHWAWIPVDVKFPQAGYAGGIQKIQFIDNKYGWFWGDDSYSLDWIRSYSWALGRTTDGGLTWQIQSSSRSNDGMQIDMDLYNRQLAAERNDSSIFFYDFSFIDRKHGWAIGRIEYVNKGSANVVFRTSTGGDKWNASSFLPGNPNPLTGILFSDKMNGYIAGQFFNPHKGLSLLLKTTTGGEIWDTVYSALSADQKAQLFFGTANSFALFTTLGYYEEAKHTLILSRNDSTEILNPVPGKHFFHLLHNTAKKLFYTLPAENDSVTGTKYFHVTGSDQRWELPYSATNYDLTDIKALDSNYAIAIGKFGTIVETIDETAWHKVTPPFPVAPNSIFITPDRTIRIACDSGIVLFKKYNDKSFRIRKIDSRHNLRLVKFINDSVGHIMSDSILYVTSDGGVTYEEIKNFPYSGLVLSDFDFADKENGFVFGRRRRPRVEFDCTELLKTTNGGMKWKDILFKFQWDNSDDVLNWGCYLKLINAKVAFLNADTGYILTDNRVYETKDCGTKWLITNQGNVPDEIQYKFAFINPGKHFLPGLENMLFSNGVINSTLATLLVKSPFVPYLHYPMSLYDRNNGWLCGKNGLIIKINMDN